MGENPHSSRSSACFYWDACLRRTGSRDGFIAMLRAARIHNVSGHSISVPSMPQHHTDSNGCVYPSLDDPEAWYCNCLGDIQHVCDGVAHSHAYTFEACIHAIMCGSSHVCESWKSNASCDEDQVVQLQHSIQENLVGAQASA